MRRGSLAMVLVLAVAIIGCQSDPHDAATPRSTTTTATPYDVNAHTEQIWTGPDGEPVADRRFFGAVSWTQGPSHCDWESTIFLAVGEPLGTDPKNAAMANHFIRDPEGVFGDRLLDTFASSVTLPMDANDTEYRNGEVELWLSPSHPNAAYIVTPAGTERWPRSDPPQACA